MKGIFFLDIDTQKDFLLRDGLLPVPGAERLVPKLRKIFDFARAHDICVISSVVARDAGDSESGDLKPHCIRKTQGQRKIDDTLLPRPCVIENRTVDRNLLEIIRKYRQVIIEKQSTDIFSNPVTEKLLRALPPHAIVFGVPLELGVRAACLGLRRMGIKTAIISDAVRPLAPARADETIAELRSAGVEIITLETLLAIPAL